MSCLYSSSVLLWAYDIHTCDRKRPWKRAAASSHYNPMPQALELTSKDQKDVALNADLGKITSSLTTAVSIGPALQSP